MKPKRSRSGAGSSPALVVAPTRVNGAMSSGIAVAPGRLGPARGPGAVARQLAGGAEAALAVYEVDARGLDRLDRSVLHALLKLFGGGPVGLSTLAVAVGEESETVEEVAEPFLVREGLLARTPRGRIATAAAWQHLGLTPPHMPVQAQQELFGAVTESGTGGDSL